MNNNPDMCTADKFDWKNESILMSLLICMDIDRAVRTNEHVLETNTPCLPTKQLFDTSLKEQASIL